MIFAGDKMKCRRCKKETPDSSKFCVVCGAKQNITRKPRGRGNGQGTVFKRPNGKWIALIITEQTLENGKVKKKTVSRSGFATKRDAENYVPVLKARQSAPDRSTLTFEQVYDMWLPTHRAGASTMNCYKAAFKHFAGIKNEIFAELALDDLQECLDDCPNGKRTRQNMKALCGLMYKYAIPRRITDNINIAQYLIITGEDGVGKVGFSDEDLSKLWANTDNRIVRIILAQCYLGFRPSEFLALRVENYDSENHTLTGGAKTEAGKNRVVTISPKIQPFIDELIGNRSSGNLVTADGAPVLPHAYRKLFYAALEACGIDNPSSEENGIQRKKYTPHSCRHTFATLMKRVEGADKDKLKLIGHTSSEMLRHYQDVSISDLKRITDAL